MNFGEVAFGIGCPEQDSVSAATQLDFMGKVTCSSRQIRLRLIR
jgi:hypothetical protein